MTVLSLYLMTDCRDGDSPSPNLLSTYCRRKLDNNVIIKNIRGILGIVCGPLIARFSVEAGKEDPDLNLPHTRLSLALHSCPVRCCIRAMRPRSASCAPLMPSIWAKKRSASPCMSAICQSVRCLSVSDISESLCPLYLSKSHCHTAAVVL